MAYWIQLMVLIQLFAIAESGLYVSDEQVASGEAASLCNLAKPEILYHSGVISISLDGTNLELSYNESVWSGYVQTNAAFLYEGCYDEGFVNSSVMYTDMYSNPGECYSRCKTDVIGMQEATCHCNPKPREAKSHASGCNYECWNPSGTVCGGDKAVSIYRKVMYPGSGGSLEKENCRAFYWQDDDLDYYAWKNCRDNYPVICETDVTSSADFNYTLYNNTLRTWREAAGLCLQEKKKPVPESGYPKFNLAGRHTAWIGQIRTTVICTDKESIHQTPGLRRGVITKRGGVYWLLFITNSPPLKSLCESVSTSTSPSDSTTTLSSPTPTTPEKKRTGAEVKAKQDDNIQFPMTSTSTSPSDSTTTLSSPPPTVKPVVVYAAVPAVLIFAAVVVIVILCKRRRNGLGNKDRTTEGHDTEPTRGGTGNAGVLYQNTGAGNVVELGFRQQDNQNPKPTPQTSTFGHEAQLDSNSQHEHQDLNPRYRKTSTHEYSTIENAAQLDGSSQNEYQDLNPRYRKTSTHEYSTIGNAAQLGGNVQHVYQDLNPRYRMTSTHEYATVGNAAHSEDEPSQYYQGLNPQYENSPTHEYSTVGNEAQLNANR